MSPYVRYYMTESLYGQVDFAFGRTKDTEEGEQINGDDAKWITKTSSFAMNFGVGYSLMWNDRIAIEPSLAIGFGSGGESTEFDFDNGIDDTIDSKMPSTFGINAGLGINIRLGGE